MTKRREERKRGLRGNGQIVQRSKVDQEGKAAFRLRYTIDGKRFSQTVRCTKADARAKLRALTNAGDTGAHVEPSKVTVADFVRDRIDQWEAAGDITAALGITAQLLAASHETQVVYVNTSGFDTHANQAATQKRLLSDLATGIARFETSVASAHIDDRVLLLTVSESFWKVA